MLWPLHKLQECFTGTLNNRYQISVNFVTPCFLPTSHAKKIQNLLSQQCYCVGRSKHCHSIRPFLINFKFFLMTDVSRRETLCPVKLNQPKFIPIAFGYCHCLLKLTFSLIRRDKLIIYCQIPKTRDVNHSLNHKSLQAVLIFKYNIINFCVLRWIL